MPDPISASSPRGSVLLFTLVILVLLGLMGVSLMVNTRSELHISQDAYQGRDAFAKADSTARLALFMGRALVSAGQAGETPCDIFLAPEPQPAGRSEFKIEVGNDGLCSDFRTTDDIKLPAGLLTLDDIADRYLQATGASGVDAPQVRVLLKSPGESEFQVVGTASVVLYNSALNAGGGDDLRFGGGGEGSIGEQDYTSQGENSIAVYLVVSADGRLPLAPGADAGNYYSDKGDDGRRGAARSLVTAVYREVVVN